MNNNLKTTIIFGKHTCLAALNNPKRKIRKIYITEKTLHDLPKNPKLPTPKIINNRDFEKILPKDSVHQGIALETTQLPNANISDIKKSDILIALDQITDPHNVGAIMRSCAAFGIEYIITPKDNSPQETGTLAKSASGTLELVSLCKVTNLSRSLEQLKKDGYWIIGLDGHTKTELHRANLSGKIVIVLGAEGKGMRKLTKDICDTLVKLPISDKVESLNVSNAAAIALYEATRK